MKKGKTFGAAGMAALMLLMAAPLAAADKAVIPDAGAGSVSGTGTEYTEAEPAANDPTLAKISKDEAVALARKLLKIPDDFKLESVGFSSRVYGSASGSAGIWRMEFFKENKQKRYYARISASIDADKGDLLNYYSYENDPAKKPSYPPKEDYDSAKTIAESFVRTMAPDKYSQVRLYELENYRSKPPLQGDVRYYFRFDRLADGIPYKQNQITVTVNGEGHVIEYDVNWDNEVQFARADQVIDQKQAEEALRNQTALSLHYVFPYQNRQQKPYVAYQAQFPNIEAVTGEARYPWGRSADKNTTDPVADRPLAKKPAGGLNLNREQAIERLTRLIPLPDDVQLDDASYDEYWNPETGNATSVWNLRWSNSGKGTERSEYIWARINSQTGELIHYSYSFNSEAQQEDRSGWLTYEQSKTAAVELVKKALPHYADQLFLQPDEQETVRKEGQEEPRFYHFNFLRIINGIQAAEESVQVTIDRSKGKVESFYSNLTDRNYPPVSDDLLTEDEAFNRLVSEFDLQLEYVLNEQIRLYGEPIPVEKYKLLLASGEILPGDPGAVEVKREAKLMYVPVPKFETEPHFLDAVTGEWRSRETGDVITLEKVEATDIAGHWAEQPLRLMLDYGAIDVRDGKVQPNAKITRGELVKMLVIAMNGGEIYFRSNYAAAEKSAASFNDVAMDSEYFAYVEAAVDGGLIDRSEEEFHPDDPMTREEMAELIVRALGYGQLAKFENMFNIPFADSEGMHAKGAAAIVVGLGIMTAPNGKFDPAKQVSRAEAAMAFYRYLLVRPTLQDKPIY
jgi:hypothetical protein